MGSGYHRGQELSRLTTSSQTVSQSYYSPATRSSAQQRCAEQPASALDGMQGCASGASTPACAFHVCLLRCGVVIVLLGSCWT
jgi:hypothetical protein